MQRLRSTFKRSRTPTGAEMKSQSSLEVPKQVRSASFDEIQLEAKRQDMRDTSSSSTANCELRSTRTTSSSSSSCSPSRGLGKRSTTLKVPMLHGGQRSKSFDVYDASSRSEYRRMADRQRSVRAPDAPSIQLSGCYHCACLEEYQAITRNLRTRRNSRLERDDANDTDDDYEDRDDHQEEAEEDGEGEDEEELDYESDIESSYYSPRDGSPEIRVTLTVPQRESEERRIPTLPSLPPPRMTFDLDSSAETSAEELRTPRRRSIASPKLSRQKALTSFPLELPGALGSSRENESKSLEDEPEEARPRRRRRRRRRDDRQGDRQADRARTDGTEAEEFEDEDDEEDDEENQEEEEEKKEDAIDGRRASKLVVRDIFLTVPELKRDRAASVDSCFDNKNGKNEESGLLTVPQQSTRSKSVDIVLPTDAQTRYTTLLPGTANDRSNRTSRGCVRHLSCTPRHCIFLTQELSRSSRIDRQSLIYLLHSIRKNANNRITDSELIIYFYNQYNCFVHSRVSFHLFSVQSVYACGRLARKKHTKAEAFA